MKKYLLALAALLAIAACTSDKNTYTVNGVADASYNNQTVYMFEYESKNKVDSAVVTDGKFTFKGSAETPVARRLGLARLGFNLIVENTVINIDMAKPDSIIGSPLNEGLSKYLKTTKTLAEDSRNFYTKTKDRQDIDEKTRDSLMNNSYELYVNELDALNADVFSKNSANALGAVVLSRWSRYISPEKFDSIYAIAGENVRGYEAIQRTVKTNERLKATAEGKPFADFTIENGNLDGSKASLSDYVGKGKYVLVDFWASWCGPCKRVMPIIDEVYKKYKGDKFEVLSVAVWNKREESIAGIEEHGMTWPQIIDAQNIPTDLYGINGIPQIMLFAPDGTIIARDLYDEAIKTKVAEVMAK